MTRICVPIVGPTVADARRQLRAAEEVADLVEFRSEQFLQLETSLPVIFKVTSLEQKGLLALAPDYVDIDESLCEQLLPHCSEKSRVICSMHDFEGMPDLEETLCRLRKYNTALYKIAGTAESALDALAVLEFMRRHPDVIGVAMGEAGEVARQLTSKVSDLWTYAPLVKEEATAPGQLTVGELGNVGRETAVYGVMGDPVRWSPGPEFHNARFKCDAIYVRFVVKRGEAAEFLVAAAKLGVRGLSVTMPLKEEVIPGEVINTLTWEGEWRGDNTDGAGAIDCVMPIAGKKVAVLGRGGTGQAVAAEARRRGAEVRIFNRVWDELKLFEYDTLIHCTTVGMDRERDECPIEVSLIWPGATVLDVVARETRLVREARARGCRVATGREMFENQALLQRKRWFGKEIDSDCSGKPVERLSESAPL